MNVTIFTLPDCQPCKNFIKIIEGIREKDPRVSILVVDVSRRQDLVDEHQITCAPTTLLDDGTLIRGVVNKEKLAALLARDLSK